MKLLQMFWIGVVNTYEIAEGQEEGWQKWADDCVELASKGGTAIQNFPSPDGKVYGKLIINNFFLGYRMIDAPKPKENIMDEVMKKQSKFFDKMNEQIDPDANEPWRQCDENH